MLKKIFMVSLGLFLMALPSFSQWVYIDPGHGGPEADQYNNGGGYNQNRGSVGQNGTSEQWVNLNVAMAIRDSLLFEGCYEGVDFKLSRIYDTVNISYQQRLDDAYNNDFAQFVSVHHNGLVSGSSQGTEVVWCDRETFDDGTTARPFEAYQSDLAKKVRYRLLRMFNYQDRCFVQNQSDPMHASSCLNCNVYILKQAAMANVISEASDISFHPDEELLFLNSSSGHAEAEASAILEVGIAIWMVRARVLSIIIISNQVILPAQNQKYG